MENKDLNVVDLDLDTLERINGGGGREPEKLRRTKISDQVKENTSSDRKIKPPEVKRG